MARPRARKPSPRPAAKPARRVPDVPLAAPLAWTVWGVLALLVLARAVTAFEPSMWA